ncbi:unnamed protein product [Ectocarpus sp. 12 AP-2014]
MPVIGLRKSQHIVVTKCIQKFLARSNTPIKYVCSGKVKMADGIQSQSHGPLIPMSEMFMQSPHGSATGTGAHNTDRREVAEQGQNLSKKGPLAHALETIDSELTSLGKVQSSNNDEIKKRMTEIQSLRENNLVVVGAIGGLKKMKDSLMR